MHANNTRQGIGQSYVSGSRALPDPVDSADPTPRLLSSAVCYALAPFAAQVVPARTLSMAKRDRRDLRLV